MSTGTEPKLIAARLRRLFAGHDGGDPGLTAARLGVDEVALRTSVDELAPHPTIEVLIAVVRHYGVDPQWLVTGEYSAAVHHRALGADGPPSDHEISRLIANSMLGIEPALSDLHLRELTD